MTNALLCILSKFNRINNTANTVRSEHDMEWGRGLDAGTWRNANKTTHAHTLQQHWVVSRIFMMVL